MEFIYTLMPHDLLKTIWIAIPLFRDDRTSVISEQRNRNSNVTEPELCEFIILFTYLLLIGF